MGSEYPAVCAHASNPFAVVSRFLLNACVGHCWPPSNSLVMSSSL
jgi:hypothetical protein